MSWWDSKVKRATEIAEANSLKFASAVEHLTNSKIHLNFSDTFTFRTEHLRDNEFKITVYRGGRGYYKPEIIQRSVNHELSHILFKSQEGLHLLKQIFSNKSSSTFNLVRNIYNAFEDYRVDNLYLDIYPGERKYNKQWNTALLKRGYFIPSDNDPLTILAKFNYDIKPKNDKEQEIFSLLEKVKGKTVFHSVLLTVYFYINYYTDNTCTLEELFSKNIHEIQQMISEIQETESYRNSFVPSDILNDKPCEFSLEENVQSLIEREEEELHDLLNTLISDYLELQEIEDIYDIKVPTTPNKSITIDYELVNSLSRMVSKAIENIFSNKSAKYINCQYGANLDMDSLIQSEFNPSISDVFLIDRKLPKLSIIFLLDCSGSMKSVYNQAIHAFLILKKAFGRLSNLVKIEAYGFSSTKHLKVDIYDLNDEKSIRCVVFDGRTPISNALEWIYYNKSDMEKAVLVLVTDGYTNIVIGSKKEKESIGTADDKLLELVRETILKLKNKNIHTTAFLVDSSRRVARYYPNHYLISKEKIKNKPITSLLQPIIQFCINCVAKEVMG